MELPVARVGPYVRALQAGLHALAPNDLHVPPSRGMAHLAALDPALSGTLLLPAEVDAHSGMPAWTWLMRVRAEAVIAQESGPEGAISADELARARLAEPALADRLEARNALHRFLRSFGGAAGHGGAAAGKTDLAAAVLEATALSSAVRRLVPGPEPQVDVVVTHDRILPDGRWQRLSMDLRGPEHWLSPAGIFSRRSDGDVDPDPGVRHLLTRHGLNPLLALVAAVEEAVGGRVLRLSRGCIGPFWFPGGPLPQGVPDALQRALTLHLVDEILADDIAVPAHLDPWQPPPRGEIPPEGLQIFRQRRFAVSPPAVEPLRRWCEERGAPTVVVPLRPAPDPSRAGAGMSQPVRRSL